MTDPILPFLACVACLLLVLAGVQAWVGARAQRGEPIGGGQRGVQATGLGATGLGATGRGAIGRGAIGLAAIDLAAIGLAGLGGLLAAVWLILGGAPVRLALPIGPPGASLTLMLDPLAGFVLVLVCVAGTAAIAFATERHGPARRQTAPPLPSSQPARPFAGLIGGLGAAMLTLLAADAATLALGLSATGLALWLTEPRAGARALPCAALVGSGLAAAAAMLVLAPFASAPFASAPFASVAPAMGATPVGPARAILVMVLALAGPGAVLGLLPGWRSPLLAGASPAARALVAGCVMPVAATILLRLVLAPHPPDPSFWWGVPALLLGGFAAVQGAWRAAAATGMPAVLTALIQRHAGLIAIGIGLVLFARSADLPDMAGLALAAVCLLLAGFAFSGALVFLAAWAAGAAAGTVRLDRLGGLWHRMPVTGTAMLVGLAGLTVLPPGIGFAAVWELAQAILAAPRSGLWFAWTVALLVFVLGASAALSLVAALRLLGMAFLGRPRLPRSSAAEEIPRPARIVLLTLSGLGLLVGLLPALVPALLARPAIRGLTEGAERADPDLLSLAAATTREGYAPMLIAVLVGIALVVALRLLRRPAEQARATPAWADGFAPPPPWLPYGDPFTQTDGVGFVPEIPATALVKPRWLALSRRRARRLGPWLILVPLVLAALAGVLAAMLAAMLAGGAT